MAFKSLKNIILLVFIVPRFLGATEPVTIVGIVDYIGISEYEKPNEEDCAEDFICFLPYWHLYEIDSPPFLEKQGGTFIVAHKANHARNHERDWVATIHQIHDPVLRSQIGADFILLDFEMSDQVFCPSAGNLNLFSGLQSDFMAKDGKTCFSWSSILSD